MRYEPDHKERTHRRIVKSASRQFRREGINGPGVAKLMKASGLTHGGFYKHFASKDEICSRKRLTRAFARSERSLPVGKGRLPRVSFGKKWSQKAFLHRTLRLRIPEWVVQSLRLLRTLHVHARQPEGRSETVSTHTRNSLWNSCPGTAREKSKRILLLFFRRWSARWRLPAPCQTGTKGRNCWDWSGITYSRHFDFLNPWDYDCNPTAYADRRSWQLDQRDWRKTLWNTPFRRISRRSF